MSRSLLARLRRRFGPQPDSLSRREMLQASIAAGASLLLSFSSRAADRPKPGAKRVVIVGAGLGGLSCAHELASAGYEVTVYEARDRVGGRTLSFTDLVKDTVIDGGAEFISGFHSTWHAYAEKFKLKLREATDDDSESPILLAGKRLSTAEAQKLWQEMDACFRRVNDEARKIDAHKPWDSINARALDRKTVANWIAAQKDISDLCRRALEVQMTAYNGMPTAWQSYLGHLAAVKGGGVEKYWDESDTHRCEGGAQSLAKKLAEALGDRVKLGKAVKEIRMGGKTATVTLVDGTTRECDDVVLAVPPSTWTRIGFDPPLPANLTPQMGTNLKFLVVVRERFWKGMKLSPECLTDGPVCTTWEGTDGQKGEGACLTVFAGGPAADVGREWSPKDREKNYLDALEQLYPGVRKQFVQARFMNWPSDPWTKGSYSFPAPGQITSIGPTLYQGLGQLHFAGEHTCYAFPGFMEGALYSGVSLAKRLAERDGIAKNG